jgi:hypothetical protein
MNIMKINTFLAVVCSSLVVLGSGCVPTDTGGYKGGFPAHDTIQARYPRPVEQVTDAARVVLKREGKLTLDNIVDNTFQAKVNERDVYVRVSKVDAKITLLQVQARTDLGADIDLAAQIDKEIALQLTTINP